MVEPILKWAGGKRQLLDKIVPRLPSDYNRYFEPFFGGGAVFFAVEPENGYINDINPRLMNFYRQVKRIPDRIIAGNKRIDDEFLELEQEEQEEFYYERRDEFNELREDGKCKNKVREAVLLLFLNRTCWNGLYRTNEKGEFNVPMGNGSTPIRAIEPRFQRAYEALQSTDISSQDFEYIRDIIEQNDLVFLDPPYPAETKTAKFDKYFEGSFGEENQKRVRDLAIDLHEKGVNVLITNGPSADRFYNEETLPEDFRIQKVYGQRMINSDSSKRTEIGATDIVATNISTFGIQKEFDDFR
jgi:DNA adenine methylase